MAPLSNSLDPADVNLTTSLSAALCTVQLPLNATQTDLYYFVFGTVSFGRAAGSTQILVTTKLVATPATGGGVSMTIGAPQGISMSLSGAAGVSDSQSVMQIVKVAAGSPPVNVKLHALASATGVKALSSTTQGGAKVTTLVAFRTP